MLIRLNRRSYGAQRQGSLVALRFSTHSPRIVAQTAHSPPSLAAPSMLPSAALRAIKRGLLVSSKTLGHDDGS